MNPAAPQGLNLTLGDRLKGLDQRQVALQRGQLEELIQSMSRSRDENVVGDIEAAIRQLAERRRNKE